MLPLTLIVPPIDSATIINDAFYVAVVIMGAIFATEYAAWRIGHKLKKIEAKAKAFEKSIAPLMETINKINAKEIDSLLKNVSGVAAAIKMAIEKPQQLPDLPPLQEEKTS